MRNNIISLRYFNIACRCILNCGKLVSRLQSPIPIRSSALILARIILAGRISTYLTLLGSSACLAVYSVPVAGSAPPHPADKPLPLPLPLPTPALFLPFNNTFVHRKIIAAGHVIFWMACNLPAFALHAVKQYQSPLKASILLSSARMYAETRNI